MDKFDLNKQCKVNDDCYEGYGILSKSPSDLQGKTVVVVSENIATLEDQLILPQWCEEINEVKDTKEESRNHLMTLAIMRARKKGWV